MDEVWITAAMPQDVPPDTPHERRADLGDGDERRAPSKPGQGDERPWGRLATSPSWKMFQAPVLKAARTSPDNPVPAKMSGKIQRVSCWTKMINWVRRAAWS